MAKTWKTSKLLKHETEDIQSDKAGGHRSSALFDWMAEVKLANRLYKKTSKALDQVAIGWFVI